MKSSSRDLALIMEIVLLGMIDESIDYYIGSWRRSMFDPSILPQSLSIDEKSMNLCLTRFDAPANNLWRFSAVRNGGFALQLMNPSRLIREKYRGDCLLVSPSLSLCSDTDRALVFVLEPHEPFRNGPMDVSMRMYVEDGSSLVSIEKSGRVLLADPIEAEGGNALVNIAWEVTPDTDEAIQGTFEQVPDWLHEMLLA
jgi:hypothetical protein